MITQAALQIGTFAWTEADPVSLAWLVDADWSGTYEAQIRKTHQGTGTLVGAFTVTAVYDSPEYPDHTLFTMAMTQAESALVPAGRYFCDIQQVGGVTRVWGKVTVQPQVTVP